MISSHPILLSAMLAVFAGAAPAQTTALQYGFDFTSGTVADHGGTVTDDTGNGNAGKLLAPGRGNGGTYTNDIPDASIRQFTTGIGSLDIGGGNALSTGTGATAGEALNGLSAAQVGAAGGITYELWVKNASHASAGGHLLVLGGMHGIAIDAGKGVGVLYGDGGEPFLAPATPIDTSAWTHIAVTMATTDPDAKDFTNISLYVDGAKVAEDADGHTFPWFLERGLGVGKHGVFDGDDADGLIYEPRISVGVLDPSQFTIVPQVGGLDAPAAVSGSSNGGGVQLSVALGNTAGVAYHVTSLSYSGPNAGDFSDSTALPLPIPAGGGRDILVDFNPSGGPGAYQATLVIGTDDPNHPSLATMLNVDVHGPSALPILGFSPQPAKAALMTVHAHSDDEGIFLGGTIPYYAMVRGLPTVHVLMTDGAGGQNHRTADGSDRANVMVTQDGETIYLREGEMYNAARIYGLPSKPVLGHFADGGGGSWGNENALDTSPGVVFMVEQIRTFRPEVIVTVAANGEYTHHVDHLATYRVVTRAYDLAADAYYRPDLGAPWDVKKLYLHASIDDRSATGPVTLTHSWEERFGILDLDNSTVGFDGDLGFFVNTDVLFDASTRDIAKQALRQHASQSPGFYTLLDDNPDNDTSPGYPRVESIHENSARNKGMSEWWDLHRTRIGADSRGRDDFFENMDLRPFGATLIARYGFHGSEGGSVNAAGGEVFSFDGGTAGAHVASGDGGTFRNDHPTTRLRNATGASSLDLSTGALSTGGDGEGGSTTFGDIRANGGITLEAWINGAGDGTGTDKILSVAGAFNLQLSEGTLQAANGFDGTAAECNAPLADWTHAAAVFRLNENDPGSGSPLILDIELYVDGILMGVADATSFTSDLDRGIGIGDHPLATGERYEGSVFEPVVSLGALSEDSFVTLVPASTNEEHVRNWLTCVDGAFPGSFDPAVVGFGADPDHDGQPNAMEFWRGTRPDLADMPAPAKLGVTNQSGSNYGTLEVEVDSAADDLMNIIVETSADLKTWQDVSATRTVLSDDGGRRLLRYSGTAPLPPDEQRFFYRFRAEGRN